MSSLDSDFRSVLFFVLYILEALFGGSVDNFFSSSHESRF